MNHTYRLVWSDLLATYVPVPESAHGRGKSARVRVLCGVVLAALSISAYALPTGGQVAVGQGSIAQSGSAMTVNQQSSNLAINWLSFGIGASESVRFAQPNTSAIALNRVLGADPSQIYGRLSANGQVWLLNPNGVLFGGGAQVNVGGLVASTLQMSDANFLAGRRTFSGNGGSVVNQGSLTAAEGGYIALLGGHVSNEGVIQAKLGTVALGAGKQITLDFAGDKLLNLQVDQGAVDALVQNKQLIEADGGTVLLSARAANALLDTVVNNTGIIEARTIDNRSGTIKLLGGMEGGTVQVGGTLDASAPNAGDGGFIETSGAHVRVTNTAVIYTAAPQGRTGQWLIDPVDYTIAASGGDITGATLAGQLDNTNVTILSSRGSTNGSGDVNVNDAVSWNSANGLTLSALHSVNVNQAISNAGSGGLTLRSDNSGACVAGASGCGTVNFAGPGHVTVNGGVINLYYNPPGTNNTADANGNGPSYASPTDYSGNVNLNGGSTLSAWMLVNDVNQLQAMNTNRGGSYALGRDVDATATVGWNVSAGFVPVGDGTILFSGQFDGGGHVISGLTINRPTTDQVGLFGANRGNIANVGLADANVHGNVYVGGLVGLNDVGKISSSYVAGSVNGGFGVGGLVGTSDFGTISGSHAAANVSGATNYVGGLVGSNYRGTISGSYATGSVTASVTGSGVAGGLVGINFCGTVSSSYATGNVNGVNSVGGLVGISNEAAISNSYATGSVTGSDSVGGLVGSIYSGTISNSYATGSVSGNTNLGGLVGFNDFNGTVIQNSYWDTTTSGQSTSAGGTGLTTAQMMQQASFTGFDFANTWWMSEGNTRPFLRMEHSTTISNAHQLQLMALNPSATYTLARNIDMGELKNGSGLWNVSAGFVPVDFSGEFDGGGHVISGLTINRPTMSGVGLFGDNTGSIANVGLTGGSVSGYAYVGGLVGANGGTLSNAYTTGSVSVSGDHTVGGLAGFNGGTINGSHAAASVNGTAYFVGGLVGYMEGGTLTNSYATGSVTGDAHVGGLLGISNETNISNSYATGSVTGRSSVGGLMGTNDESGLSNSYATGSVTGSDFVGGLLGSSSGPVSNSYATGSVQGQTNVGGLVGAIGGSPGLGSISNSYATGSVQGQTNVGGLVGVIGDLVASISNSYATGSVHGQTNVGGLVGLAGGTEGSISNSYATGSVQGQTNVGGLAGSNEGAYTVIDTSYATGSVSGVANVGGLVGSNTGTISNSYWDTTTSGQSTSAGGTGLTTTQMMQLASFSNWNTATPNTIASTGGSGATWRIYEGHTAPLLTSFLTPLTLSDAPDVTLTYKGSAQTGPSTAIAGVLGAAANGTNAGFYNGYYSTQQGYDITGGNLVINPAALSAISLSGTRVYDSTVYVDHSIFTLSGLVGSQTLTLSGVGTVADKNVGTNKPVTLGTLALGDGSNGGLASNYTFSGGIQTASITKATLTLTTGNVVKPYDGTTSAAGSAFATAGTRLFGSDSLSGGSFVFTDKNAGTNKKVTVGNVTVNDGNGGNNYTVGYLNNTTSTINKAVLTGNIIGNPTKVYDGDIIAHLKSSNFSLGGVVSGESIMLRGTPSKGSYNSPNVSQASTVTASLRGAEFTAGRNTRLSNYLLPASASGSGHITPATLTYEADKTKLTQGSIIPTLTGSLTGFVHKETLASATTGTVSWLTTATPSSAAGDYSVNGSGLTANFGNYVFVQASKNATALTIKPCKPTKNTTCP